MSKIKLSEIPTLPPAEVDEAKIRALTKRMTRQIADLQHLLYAEEKHSLLIIFQGMDATGKDGATRRVLGRCSPTGIHVKSFKKPTDEEFDHDFLWRVHKHAPRKGMIQVFNRSHYEDILIQRVHGWIDEARVDIRMNAINSFEQLLQQDNGTVILKFYMHISRERQREKLQERIDNPLKNWKHNDGDWDEAELWDDYMRCYEDAINRSVIPWYIVPVDKRWYRDYIIAKEIVEVLETLEMQLPMLESEKFNNGESQGG